MKEKRTEREKLVNSIRNTKLEKNGPIRLLHAMKWTSNQKTQSLAAMARGINQTKQTCETFVYNVRPGNVSRG